MSMAAPTMAQAIASGLQIDPQARARGQQDAEQGLPCRIPAGADPLSYASGYAAGRAAGVPTKGPAQ